VKKIKTEFVISGIVFVVCYDHGPNMEYGFKNCGQANTASHIFISVYVILYLVINGILVHTFFKYRQFSYQSIPGVPVQFQLNFIVSTSLFLSSIISGFIGTLWRAFDISENYVSAHLLGQELEFLFHSVLMYAFVFSHIQSEEGFWNSESEEISSISFSDDIHSNSTNIVTEGLEEEFRWLSFPGGHPMLCDISTIRENDLEDFIILKKKKLRQIKKYQNRGLHIPSLFQFVRSTNELIESMDSMGILTDAAEMSRISVGLEV